MFWTLNKDIWMARGFFSARHCPFHIGDEVGAVFSHIVDRMTTLKSKVSLSLSFCVSFSPSFSEQLLTTGCYYGWTAEGQFETQNLLLLLLLLCNCTLGFRAL